MKFDELVPPTKLNPVAFSVKGTILVGIIEENEPFKVSLTYLNGTY